MTDQPLDQIRQEMRRSYLPDEDQALARLLGAVPLAAGDRQAVSARAADLVEAVRRSAEPRLMEAFLAGLWAVDQRRASR